MPDRPRHFPIDYDALAEFLNAVGSPVRLELLHILRFPHTLREIRLNPRRSPHDESPDRAAARGTLLGHLEKLEEADLVHVEQVEREGRIANLYQANALQIYALSEELRRLSVIHAGHGPPGDATGTLAPVPVPDEPQGPRLVLVYGLYEGKAFRLDPRRQPERGWVIGRKKGLPISLDYDPFVSVEHATVTCAEGGWTVADLDSKNGTWVNWRQLQAGGSRVLKAGDVIGLGRSMLCLSG